MIGLQWFWIVLMSISSVLSDADTDYNVIKNDGSFSFGLTNSDVGSHYHRASGNPKHVVRGRFGSRNPETGNVDETIYTAGPRGFRARGPNIHRQMDLSQTPRGPIGSPDDPLADPYDTPRYGFGFKTYEYKRREEADDNGRVRGLYSYLDDIGEKHTVRYAAGAGTGFEVLNAVPDSPAAVHYSAPLYKGHKEERGKIAYERGPGGLYRFISSGPDQRRSEAAGPDGLVRGSYSYLDNKGVQRTVQYIAGAGIGYRVLHSTTGFGTHNLPNPSLPEFGVSSDPSADAFANHDFDYYAHNYHGLRDYDKLNFDEKVKPVRPTRPHNSHDSSGGGGGTKIKDNSFEKIDDEHFPARPTKRPTSGSHGIVSSTTTRPSHHHDSVSSSHNRFDSNEDYSDFNDKGYEYKRPTHPPPHSNHRPTTIRPFPSKGTSRPDKNPKHQPDAKYDTKWHSEEDGYDDGQYNEKKYDSRPFYLKDGPFYNRHKLLYDDDFDNDYYERQHAVSHDYNKLEKDRDDDWRYRHRDSTLIRNMGNWFIGLPPGGTVRAHVHNIDLVPLGGRAISPSEALKRDELRRSL